MIRTGEFLFYVYPQTVFRHHTKEDELKSNPPTLPVWLFDWLPMQTGEPAKLVDQLRQPAQGFRGWRSSIADVRLQRHRGQDYFSCFRKSRLVQ